MTYLQGIFQSNQDRKKHGKEKDSIPYKSCIVNLALCVDWASLYYPDI
jgi:hypothetical protein